VTHTNPISKRRAGEPSSRRLTESLFFSIGAVDPRVSTCCLQTAVAADVIQPAPDFRARVKRRVNRSARWRGTDDAAFRA
jgi:hypothetical protein